MLTLDIKQEIISKICFCNLAQLFLTFKSSSHVDPLFTIVDHVYVTIEALLYSALYQIKGKIGSPFYVIANNAYGCLVHLTDLNDSDTFRMALLH